MTVMKLARYTTTGASVKTGTSTLGGVKSSFISTFKPCTTLITAPPGPMRSGPMRRFISAMIFISM